MDTFTPATPTTSTSTTATPTTATPTTATPGPGSAGAGYIHGYSEREAVRLGDQANALADLLHAGTHYPAGSGVLEIGCGVGAQTVHLVRRSPEARLMAVDRSAESLAAARARVAEHAPGALVEWRQADLFDLPFAEGEFDHVFVCFVLEHLSDPIAGLERLRRVLRPGGSLTVIEGDHGSAFFHPDSALARAAIDCQARLQRAAGGDALLGRRLLPLLRGAGFERPNVRPCTVWADRNRPELMTGFTRDTFIPAIASVRAEALAAGLASAEDWDRGIVELRRTAVGEGSFHYTFFKAVAHRPA
ncbi:methyltransferase domain-containing protein [Streptomyces sp. 3MP-14]|uniref:Methyltransferase domain-containing protein n=1 Tax=Streptomyces mimosae TaxID=2586635 RepID=A0A5N6A3R8_9ACTN|nr:MULTISPECIES: class I SAM-dependent methyltransferase [Streptomyces]KAB8163311.1 methyltransferase domain-containing protein [Streptomyces mimosae]KAB8174588.1 methyltransferase domain-containing protein [Streptomyces sp. 3MP-14]